MLQKYSVQDQPPHDDDSQGLTPAYFIDILKRRLLYFLVPFVVTFGIGATVVAFIPAVYLAEGKILVESQQIPSDLVRPTVSAMANERILTISQRILTRDNLLAIATKYQLFSGRRKQLTGTEMVDWMRDNTKIKPVEIKTASRPNAVTLAFTVGFEHEQPVTAMRVANEFMTMILSEDVRVRTSFASETTKFLEREVKRLEAELAAVDVKLAEMKRDQVGPAPQGPADLQLNALRSELLQKAATYSDAHPDMKAIKLKIAALEKNIAAPKDAENGREGLERQHTAIEKNLEATGQKLTAAKLGESLERGQQSERLEVIEQPALPQKPVRPNRIKSVALVFILSLMAGGGLVFVLEALQRTIYRTADILRIADSQLVISIPYISTEAELLRRRSAIILSVGISVLVLVVAAAVSLFFLPPLDILFNGIFTTLGM